MPVVYSTATSDINYCDYWPGLATEASSRLKRKVLIKGGANLAPVAGRLVTPLGMATIVSDDELAFLEVNSAFQRHIERGFMRVEKGNKSRDANVVAKDGMTPRDGSAPLTKDSKDYLKGATPVVTPTESSKARMK